MPGVGYSLYTGSGAAAPALIVDRLSGGFFDFGSRPAIAAGLVAFEGVRPSGIHGIYTTRGGLVTTIADNAGIFFDFVDPAVNSLGEVAFVAGLVGGDWPNSGRHALRQLRVADELVVSFGQRQRHRGGGVSGRMRVDGRQRRSLGGHRRIERKRIGQWRGGVFGGSQLVRERANGHAHDRRPGGRGDPDRLFVCPLIDQQVGARRRR
jgi:hypothetical protein